MSTYFDKCKHCNGSGEGNKFPIPGSKAKLTHARCQHCYGTGQVLNFAGNEIANVVRYCAEHSLSRQFADLFDDLEAARGQQKDDCRERMESNGRAPS